MTNGLKSVRLRRGWGLAASFFVLALGGAGAAQKAPQQFFPATYDIEDLGTINGRALATGINNSGQVAGFAFNGPDCCAQAFLFTPPGPARYRLPISYGNGVND